MRRRNDPYRQNPYGGNPYGGNPYGGDGPYGPYGGYGGYRGYRRRRPLGGGCVRDACLLESGCCLAESLGGNCLVLAIALAGRLAATALSTPRRSSDSAQALLLEAIARYRREISAARATPCCRFTPSCSAYAEEAVRRHGALRGSVLAARRVLRCRPGGRRGYDLVPD